MEDPSQQMSGLIGEQPSGVGQDSRKGAVAKLFGAVWLCFALPVNVLVSILRLRGMLRRGCLGEAMSLR